MTLVVGLRWKKVEPIVFAKTNVVDLPTNSYIVVQGEKGQELGWVVREPKELVASQPEDQPALTVVRKATSADMGRLQEIQEMQQEAFKTARTKVRELGLAMKVVEAHYTFDRSRVIVSFGAEGRVDFRPLLHELGSALRCRVELHQIGDRDVAKITGGIGRCGQLLCCARWLTAFETISIRMAKEQALPINADGLAGACGRLRCCLRYEYEQYREVNRAMPKIGEEVRTPNGLAKVIVGHQVKETVTVRYEGDEMLELPLADLERLSPSRN